MTIFRKTSLIVFLALTFARLASADHDGFSIPAGSFPVTSIGFSSCVGKLSCIATGYVNVKDQGQVPFQVTLFNHDGTWSGDGTLNASYHGDVSLSCSYPIRIFYRVTSEQKIESEVWVDLPAAIPITQGDHCSDDRSVTTLSNRWGPMTFIGALVNNPQATQPQSTYGHPAESSQSSTVKSRAQAVVSEGAFSSSVAAIQ